MDKIDLIRETLTADFSTGQLFWAERPRAQFSSDGFWRRSLRDQAGQPVALFKISRYGHLALKIYAYGKQHQFLAHRAVWALAKGELPDADLDHINNDPSDNRIVNLRTATRAQNRMNAARHRSGLKGAYFKRGRWGSNIWVDGRSIPLGYFDTEKEAHEAYVRAAFTERGPFANPGYASVFD